MSNNQPLNAVTALILTVLWIQHQLISLFLTVSTTQ